MRNILLAAALMISVPAFGQEIYSDYTEIDQKEGCAPFAGAGDDDWLNLVCPGWRGYPVLVYYGDLRESLFYGFPPEGDLAPTWESFISFNSTGPRIEWRIARNGAIEIPFATIHRWFVSDPEFPDEEIEVLVVEKVGQILERQGCVVGYVVATGNTDPNEKARRIADNQARDFMCGADQPAIEAGSVLLPDPTGGG
jgi:hypothetical protein